MTLPTPKHFLDLDVMAASDLRHIIETAKAVKAGNFPGGEAKPLAGKSLAMIFEKPSTRTRISFELAMKKLGGDVVVLERESSQLGRGETVADTARVLSRYVDCIMVRTTREH
jgi:ornithine carbamoyltransferase